MNRLILIIGLTCVLGCDPEEAFEEPIPFIPFADIRINLTNIEFNDLRFDGGFVELGGGVGVRGIILYRENINTYHAYEQNCSYQPNEACALVEVDVSGLFMTDNCCGSNFSFPSGQPSRGPASLPLRRYRTILNGNQLTITSDIL